MYRSQFIDRARVQRYSARAALAWKVVLFLVPAGVAVFAAFVVAAVRANSAALDIDARVAISNRTAGAVDAYIAHIVDDARAMADVPAVREQAAAAGQMLAPAQSAAIDKAWKARRVVSTATDVDQLIGQVRAQPISKYFEEMCNRKGAVFREILLTDRDGKLVAASATTEDYEQQDELWWKEAIGRSHSCTSPRECAYAGDVGFDPSAGANAFDVAVPVFGDGAEVVGVLKVVVDPRDIGALLALATAGHPVSVSLIRRNGIDVFVPSSPFVDSPSGGSPIVPQQVLDDLVRMGADQQIAVALSEEESVPVRALAGPHFDKWAVAVRDRAGRAGDSRIQLSVLVAVVFVMFVLSARAYSLLFQRAKAGA